MNMKEQIKFIMEDFDFNKISKIVKCVEWKWEFGAYSSDEKITHRIPNITELKLLAEECLQKVSKSEDVEAIFSSGGFEAIKIENVLELRFVIEKSNILSTIFNSTKTPHNDLERKA